MPTTPVITSNCWKLADTSVMEPSVTFSAVKLPSETVSSQTGPLAEHVAAGSVRSQLWYWILKSHWSTIHPDPRHAAWHAEMGTYGQMNGSAERESAGLNTTAEFVEHPIDQERGMR